MFHSRHYNISQGKKGSSISQEYEQPVTCLNANYFLGTPVLLVEVRTHGARHAVSIWSEDNPLPEEMLPPEAEKMHIHMLPNTWE